MARLPDSGCIRPGCPGRVESHLGCCAACWASLPARLRDEWWQAWQRDARTRVWLAARRACVEYWERNGA